MAGEQVQFSRDCEAVEIPAGTRVTVPQGVVGYITQSLGGSYTLQIPSMGGLFRISADQGDAIGQEVASAPVPVAEEEGDLEAQVWAQLKTCYDPEIPVNIVDLGLVYDLQLAEGEAGGKKVEVKMTLTAQGRGMGATIAEDARGKILALPGVEAAGVDVVWDPPWSPQMISPEGRQTLGMD